MNNFSDTERAQQIDRYLAGRLTTEEIRQLETALAQDSAWQQAYEDAKLTRSLAQAYGLRDDIRLIRTAMLRENTPEATLEPMTGTPMTPPTETVVRPSEAPKSDAKVRPLSPVFGYAGRIAAGLALLLVGFFGFQYATLSGDDLYAERATVYQVAASRSSEEPTASPEDQLEQHYRAQRFAETTTAYEQLNTPSLMAMFLAGNAYLQQDEADQAIAAFQEIVRINGRQGINRFEEDAQYYLALSYLKADRPDEALPLLEKINDNPQHSYHALVGDYYLWKVKFLNRIQ